VPSIVRFYLIAMVNFKFWPFTSYQNPNDPMCEVFFTADTNLDSPLIIERASAHTRGCAFRQRYFPEQHPCRWGVLKNSSYKFCAEIVVRIFMASHAVALERSVVFVKEGSNV